MGTYNTTFFNLTLNPNATYYQNDTITFEANLSSLGLETTDQLNGTYATSVNVTLEQNNSVQNNSHA